MYDVFESKPTTLIHDDHRRFRYVAHEHLEDAVALHHIADGKGLSEMRARNIFSQISYALQHCHARNVAHG